MTWFVDLFAFARGRRVRKTVTEYRRLADSYARDGFLLKAVDAWRKVSRLDPASLEPYQRIADLYVQQGLLDDAKAQFLTIVDEYVKRSRIQAALDVLKKMAEVDPSDLKVRAKLGDLYEHHGYLEEAVNEHLVIADGLGRKGHLVEAAQVLEKGLRIDPDNPKLRIELDRVRRVH